MEDEHFKKAAPDAELEIHSLDSVPGVENETSGFALPLFVVIGMVIYENDVIELTELARSLDAAIAFARRAGQAALGTNQIHTKILVWNNGSLRSELGTLGRSAEVFQDGNNLGFGCSHNELMRRAFERGAHFYVGLNPDGILHPHALVELLDMAVRFQGDALVEGCLFPGEHPKPFDPLTFDTPWISGGCFMMPARIFEAVGGFDKNLFLYSEDVDLS